MITPIATTTTDNIKKQRIIDACDEWASALRSKYVDSIVRLYNDNVVLIGTFATSIVNEKEYIKNYFMHLMKKEKLDVAFNNDFNIRFYGDIVINSGTYIFSWVENNNKIVVPARFTFVYKYSYGNWEIIEHHSSMIPKS
jgi:hypothetical protein